MNEIHTLLRRCCLDKLHRPRQKAFYRKRIEEFYEYFLKAKLSHILWGFGTNLLIKLVQLDFLD